MYDNAVHLVPPWQPSSLLLKRPSVKHRTKRTFHTPCLAPCHNLLSASAAFTHAALACCMNSEHHHQLFANKNFTLLVFICCTEHGRFIPFRLLAICPPKNIRFFLHLHILIHRPYKMDLWSICVPRSQPPFLEPHPLPYTFLDRVLHRRMKISTASSLTNALLSPSFLYSTVPFSFFTSTVPSLKFVGVVETSPTSPTVFTSLSLRPYCTVCIPDAGISIWMDNRPLGYPQSLHCSIAGFPRF